MTATQPNRPTPGGATDPESIASARRDRRRRTIYASLAGWTLLGAASVGLVACSTSAASGTTTSSAATTADEAATSGASRAATSAASSAPAGQAATSAASSAAAAGGSPYQDGTYTATGSYTSPGGTEEVTVTLTIADGVITGATAEGGATRPPSSQYQSEFVTNFAALIVGKDIAEVSLDKVAGSSLTSGGFNEAVETIKSQAQA